jgi:hypothetical protein
MLQAGQFVSASALSWDELVGWWVTELVEIFCSWDRGQFGYPEEGERPPLEAVTRIVVKTQQAEKP